MYHEDEKPRGECTWCLPKLLLLIYVWRCQMMMKQWVMDHVGITSNFPGDSWLAWGIWMHVPPCHLLGQHFSGKETDREPLLQSFIMFQGTMMKLYCMSDFLQPAWNTHRNPTNWKVPLICKKCLIHVVSVYMSLFSLKVKSWQLQDLVLPPKNLDHVGQDFPCFNALNIVTTTKQIVLGDITGLGLWNSWIECARAVASIAIMVKILGENLLYLLVLEPLISSFPQMEDGSIIQGLVKPGQNTRILIETSHLGCPHLEMGFSPH